MAAPEALALLVGPCVIESCPCMKRIAYTDVAFFLYIFYSYQNQDSKMLRASKYIFSKLIWLKHDVANMYINVKSVKHRLFLGPYNQ